MPKLIKHLLLLKTLQTRKPSLPPSSLLLKLKQLTRKLIPPLLLNLPGRPTNLLTGLSLLPLLWPMLLTKTTGIRTLSKAKKLLKMLKPKRPLTKLSKLKIAKHLPIRNQLLANNKMHGLPLMRNTLRH